VCPEHFFCSEKRWEGEVGSCRRGKGSVDRERNGSKSAGNGERVLPGFGQETEELWARKGWEVRGVSMCEELCGLSVKIRDVDWGPKGCSCEEGCNEFCVGLDNQEAVVLIVAPCFGVVGGVRRE